MGLNGRVSRLEARLTATAQEDDADVQLWTLFFASARRWPEDRETTGDHILGVDRQVTGEFLAYCRATGQRPTIVAFNKWPLSG